MSSKKYDLNFKLDLTNYNTKLGTMMYRDPLNNLNVTSPLRINQFERIINPNPGQYGAFGPLGKPTNRW